MLRVGFLKRDQNWNRNILCHQYESLSLVRVVSLSRLVHAFLRRARIKASFLENVYFGPSAPRVHILHVWRMVCMTRIPWVVTTSVGLPFGWPRKWWPRAFKILAGPQCCKILVNSYHAKKLQEQKLDHMPEWADEILPKVEILPTPQPLLVGDVQQKSLPNDSVVLTFVGHLFFQKGGPALIAALEHLNNCGFNIRVNVVSQLKPDEFSGVDSLEIARWKTRLSSLPFVTWYPSLPNPQVLDLFRKSHAGVLLSFAEAYGYSVLEAQAAGCATITTDVGALPELNNEQCGWILPVRHLGFDLYDASSLRRVWEYLTPRLIELLSSLAAQPSKLLEKGRQALDRIRRVHDPLWHKSRLESIYWEVLDAQKGERPKV